MSVTYSSTRGGAGMLGFEEVVLGGLAEDGGLYLPERIPSFSEQDLIEMRGLSFSDLALRVISTFVKDDCIPHDDLKRIVDCSFSKFRCEEVTPTIKCGSLYVLELFHGPTFAFKDVALQFLGNLFEFFLQRGRIQQSMTVLGATSGDTGSAAIHGLRGKGNIDCFIMYPTGKVTDIQERQMTTIPDANIHCMSIDGDFDDAQALVKAAFADEAFREEVKLGAVNSINWARVLAQITYYIYSYFRVTDSADNGDSANSIFPTVSFAVPTGNFGDILAGYYAKRMGLPVDKLMVCTNQNDVLHRFLQTGEYRRTPAAATIAPSMDISVSSNFERYLYYLAGEDAAVLREWMTTFERTGVLTVSDELRLKANEDFCSFAASAEVIVQTMREVYEAEGYLVCPHTATAVAGVLHFQNSTPSATEHSPFVCLATAHPAKFEQAVSMALEGTGKAAPARPVELQALFDLEQRTTLLPNSMVAVQAFVRAHREYGKK